MLPRGCSLSPPVKGGLFGVPLRAFNEGLLRPRVERAQETKQTILHTLHSFTVIFIAIGFRGLSNSSRAAVTILSTTSIPRKTSPKTV